ncbi:MAG TPA: hypothetical protein VF228_08190, partial [Iamia sp.]
MTAVAPPPEVAQEATSARPGILPAGTLRLAGALLALAALRLALPDDLAFPWWVPTAVLLVLAVVDVA